LCFFNIISYVHHFQGLVMAEPQRKNTETFADRLRAALKEAGVRPSATMVASEFNLRFWGDGISSHAARNWLMGVSIPKQDKLLALSKWLKVAPEGLVYGTRPATFQDGMIPDEMTRLVDQQLVANYLKLRTEHRRVVREVVDGLSALGSKNQ
jgi:hypothetical protein